MISILVLLVAFVFLALFVRSTFKPKPKIEEKVEEVVEAVQKPNYGHLQIFYASQTGTAAKMSEGLAEEATEKGFEPEVIDLKDITFEHFDVRGDISIFLMANTGEGEFPDNSVKFMKVIKDKEDLHEEKVVDWGKVAFTVFGLGNTQYQFYNKVGIDTDALLEKKGGKRVYEIGLGDNNASLEDDYLEWKANLWETLIKYRAENPLERKIERKQSLHNEEQKHITEKMDIKNRQYISSSPPILANYRLFTCEAKEDVFPYTEEDLDFKTKGSLKAKRSKVSNIHETRQNVKDGSTLEIEVELENQPQYATAGNIALYPVNDPKILKEIIEYFKLSESQLESRVSVEKVNPDKKVKLNFIPDLTLREVLYECIDVQGRVTKSVLKKLSKFESDKPSYFSDNSSPKTTEEFRRITENTQEPHDWYYLFRLVKEFRVNLGLEDFLELSDSIAPRLFTIASSWKAQKNVIVSASIAENGLISKFFESKPAALRAEFRNSSFTDAMKWQKVTFISAGTGFAPFRGYLQEKELLLQRQKNGQEVSSPEVTLLFGCKHEDGDFIYKEQIMKWVETGVINKFRGAFSRDTAKKVYVQHLLQKESDLIEEFMNQENNAIYICGSLGMGHDVSEVLAQKVGGHQKVKELELKGRIVKQLW